MMIKIIQTVQKSVNGTPRPIPRDNHYQQFLIYPSRGFLGANGCIHRYRCVFACLCMYMY